jgi:hypothetical protein
MPEIYSLIRNSAVNLGRRIELHDFLVPFYCAVLLREYLWLIRSNPIAWSLTVLGALAFWLAYLYVKRPVERETNKLRWLVVVLPLLFGYLLRLPFPDRSWDVRYYHIFYSERALRGWLYIPGDFFPSYFPLLNPASDTLTGIFRHLLGYRLGTVLNLLVLLWAATVIDRILRHYVRRPWVRAFAVLLIVASEQLLFEVNTYLVDLLVLPLMLEAIYRTVWRDDGESKGKNFLVVCFLLGTILAFKLTNLIFILPILLVCLYFTLTGAGRVKLSSLKTWGTALLALIVPGIPHLIYVCWLTGSPMFPFYNTVFRSPFHPLANNFDLRFGPKGFWETLTWPVQILWHAKRFGEVPFFSGRLTVGFIAAIAGLLLIRRDGRLRALCVITLLASIVWSINKANIRYGLLLELLAGTLLICMSAQIMKLAGSATLKRPAAILLWFVLIAQTILSANYVARHGWGDQPTFLDYPEASLIEAGHLLRDRSPVDFFSDADRHLFDPVEVWIESVAESSMMMVMIKNDAPMISVFRQEFVVTEASKEKFKQLLSEVAGKRMFSLCESPDVELAKSNLKAQGFTIRNAVPILLPYYSYNIKLDMLMLEVEPPDQLPPLNNGVR